MRAAPGAGRHGYAPSLNTRWSEGRVAHPWAFLDFHLVRTTRTALLLCVAVALAGPSIRVAQDELDSAKDDAIFYSTVSAAVVAILAAFSQVLGDSATVTRTWVALLLLWPIADTFSVSHWLHSAGVWAACANCAAGAAQAAMPMARQLKLTITICYVCERALVCVAFRMDKALLASIVACVVGVLIRGCAPFFPPFARASACWRRQACGLFVPGMRPMFLAGSSWAHCERGR